MITKTLKMAFMLYCALILSILLSFVSNALADFENTYTGYLDSSNTQDDYQVTLPSDGELQIKMDFDSGLYRVDLDIYSSNGIIKIADTNFGNGDIRTFVLKAGVYKIYVSRQHSSSQYYGNYIMKVNYYEQLIANDTEPNDRYNYANTVPANGTATGHLGYTGEDGIRDTLDWWKVTLASNGEIKINLKYDSTLDPNYLKIYASDGITQIASWYAEHNKTYTTNQLNAGTYYIVLDLSRDYGGYIMQFTTPASCSYTLGSSSACFSSSGGTDTVSVISSSSSCAWTAHSNSSWITINSGTGGTGNGTVDYTVFANTSTTSRTGTLTIAGKTFTITQSGTQVALICRLVVCDLNGDSRDDVIKVDTSGALQYTTNMYSWSQISGYLKHDIACGDLNGDTMADIAGISSNGQVWYTFDKGQFWQNMPGSLSKIFVADMNGDGNADIVGLNSAGNIYISYYLQNWTNIPSVLSDIQLGNFNLSRSGNEIAGINSSSNIYFTDDLYNWSHVSGALSKMFVGEINGDGRSDLMGLNSYKEIYYSTNLSTWIKISGLLDYITTGDLNDDGKNDIVGYNSNGAIYYTTSLSNPNWIKIPGTLTTLLTGDFDGNGRDDIVGIGGDGNIYYTTDLINWTSIN